MKKLSKAQERILKEAKESIDIARNHSIKEWATKETFGYYNVDEMFERFPKRKEEESFWRNRYDDWSEKHIERFGKWYYKALENEVLVSANTRTIKALEEMGYIEIVEEGGTFLDVIKVLNY